VRSRFPPVPSCPAGAHRRSTLAMAGLLRRLAGKHVLGLLAGGKVQGDNAPGFIEPEFHTIENPLYRLKC
jgi:hypothetical protein